MSRLSDKMGFFRTAAFAAVMSFAAVAAPPAEAGQGPVVQAPAGAVEGVERRGLDIFKGIPYAAPPVGDLRWKPPAAMPAWNGVRAAKEFGAACEQPVGRPNNIYADHYPKMSEDCLTLNIWAPKKAHKMPVFVWIHGGALRAGASSESMYDGARFAKKGGVIFVSINYRLGILGYLALPELSAESPEHISGNYGLLDQIAALKWVKANIAAFGGDPDNVTVAGESAGGLSVMYLLASPPARGLFQKAIAESAYMISTPELKEKRFGEFSAEGIGTWLMKKLGANSLAELRAMDAATLATEAPKTGYFPLGTIDGQILPHQLVETFDKGEQAPVPLLAGFNSGEIRSLRFLLPKAPADADAYVKAVRAGYGELADTFLKFYPPGNIDEAMLATTRDAMYGWTAERLVRKQAALGIKSYLYLWDHGYPAADSIGLHAFHASEIPYVFGTVKRTPPLWPKVPGHTNDLKMSAAMMAYWSSFARTGNPRAKGQPDWQPFMKDESYMYLADVPHAATHLLPGMYQLHESVVCRRRAAGTIAWNWNVGVIAPPLPPRTAECQ